MGTRGARLCVGQRYGCLGVLVAHANVDIGIRFKRPLSPDRAYSPALTTSADTLLALFFSSGNGKSIWETPTGWSAAFPEDRMPPPAGPFYPAGPPGTTAPVTAVEDNILYADVGYAHLIALNPAANVETET